MGKQRSPFNWTDRPRPWSRFFKIYFALIHLEPKRFNLRVICFVRLTHDLYGKKTMGEKAKFGFDNLSNSRFFVVGVVVETGTRLLIPAEFECYTLQVTNSSDNSMRMPDMKENH